MPSLLAVAAVARWSPRSAVWRARTDRPRTDAAAAHRRARPRPPAATTPPRPASAPSRHPPAPPARRRPPRRPSRPDADAPTPPTEPRRDRRPSRSSCSTRPRARAGRHGGRIDLRTQGCDVVAPATSAASVPATTVYYPAGGETVARQVAEACAPHRAPCHGSATSRRTRLTVVVTDSYPAMSLREPATAAGRVGPGAPCSPTRTGPGRRSTSTARSRRSCPTPTTPGPTRTCPPVLARLAPRSSAGRSGHRPPGAAGGRLRRAGRGARPRRARPLRAGALGGRRGDRARRRRRRRRRAAPAARAARASSARPEGTWVEDKGRAVAVHMRRAADPQARARRCSAGPLRELAEETGLVVEPGRLVLELRPAGADKGAALRGAGRGARPSVVRLRRRRPG